MNGQFDGINPFLAVYALCKLLNFGKMLFSNSIIKF